MCIMVKIGWGRSPGERSSNPLQSSCLENPTDGGAWWATVHRVTKSRTRLKRLSTHGQKVGKSKIQLHPLPSKSGWRGDETGRPKVEPKAALLLSKEPLNPVFWELLKKANKIWFSFSNSILNRTDSVRTDQISKNMISEDTVRSCEKHMTF